MKEKLSAVVSAETGNVIAICSHVDDAIDIAVDYEMRTGKKFEIQDVTKYGAKQMVDKEWVNQDHMFVELTFSKAF